MATNEFDFDLRYDFSSLSKNRLRVYNMLAEELDKADEGHELSDDDLFMLAAAGNPNAPTSDGNETNPWQ
ncbi:MAG: hypothetical protein J6S63_08160 [Atopobiaceae bacterium]|nr:hypothetical protein [Atopobiaceae bacterium]